MLTTFYNKLYTNVFFWRHFSPKQKLYFQLVLGAILIVFSPLALMTFQQPPMAEAAWYNDNWAYRKAVTVTVTSSASDITNLQTLLTVDTTDITATLQTNCEDLRFTNVNGKLLPYYIDTCSDNSATNKVWVLADLVPKNTTTYTLYMYYGNPTAPAASDASTFWAVKDLEGYWTLNDTSGNRTDSSVNGSTLTDNGTGGVTSATGQFSNAGQFTAAESDYLSIADNASFDLSSGDFSFTAWVYLDSLPAVSSEMFFVSKDGPSFANNQREYGLLVTNDAGTIKFRFYTTNGAGTFYIADATTFGTPSTGAWYFLTGIHSATDSKNYISVNNGALDSVTSSANPPNGTNPFVIGARGQPNFYTNGRIDDIHFYKRALTTSEITQLYTNPGTIATTAVGTSGPSTSFASEEKSPGPIAYWKFDDGTGTNAQDSTANNNDGTISGATWQTEDQCITGKCLSFDGTNDVVTVSNTVGGIQTVSLWIKPITTSEQIIDINGTASISVSSGTISATGFTSPTIYVNGTASTTLSANSWQYVTVTTGTALSGSAIKIGQISTNYGQAFIDDVKLYPYARSAAQVLTDYNSRGSVKGSSAQIGSDPQNSSALNQGLVGYWKMDETSTGAGAVSRADSSGNSNTLTDVNTVISTAGKFGNAGQFTRVNSEELTIVDNASLSCGDIDFSVSAWVYFDSVSADMGIVGKSTHNLWANIEYSLLFDNATQKIHFDVSDGVATTGVAQSSSTVTTGTWYFVTGWHDSVANTVNIQLNNGAVASTSYSSGCQDGGQTFRIGNLPSVGYMNGRIEEVRMYKRVLTSADRTALYNFAPGPVGYWNMDENQGTSANDTSGNANTGTWNGTTTNIWKPGKFGAGGNFDGSTNFVQIADSSNLQVANAITMESWIKFNSSPSGLRNVITKETATAGYVLLFNSSTLTFSFHNGTAFQDLNYAGTWTPGQWYHIVGVYDPNGGSNNQKVYVNGVQVAQQTITGNITTSNQVLTIGYRALSTDRYFNGLIDDIKIYNYVRTAQQIVQDMNAGHPPPGSPVGSAVGHWKFDEGADNTCSGGTNDACNSGSQGSTLDGAESGMAVPATSTSGWTNSGKFGKALNFDESDDRVEVGTNVSALESTTFTISAWINPTTSASNKVIFYNGDVTSTRTGWGIVIRQNNDGTNPNKFYLETAADGAPAGIYGNAVTYGSWQHVAATFDAATTTAKIYQNGALITTNTSATVPTFTGDNFARIGSAQQSSDNANLAFFKGGIDEVKYYNFVLTADQIKLDMNRGSAQVFGALSDSTTYSLQASNQEYCVPGDSTSCAAPVGEWKMDEKQGTSANDTSGNGITGTLTNTPTWSSGKYGSAINFVSGNSTYINGGTNNALNFGTGDATIGYWVKTSTTSEQGLVSKRGTGTGFNTEILSNKFYADGAGTAGVSSTISINDNKWHYVTAVYDRSGAKLRLYVDGVAENTVALGATTLTDSENLTFGATKCCAGSLRFYFDGSLDDVKIYNYARTAAQIAWDFNRGGPVGWWKFDECQGTTANDSSGNGNTGTITPGAGGQTAVGTCTGSAGTLWKDGATGKYNSSLDFDGTDDYVGIAHQSFLNLGSSFTLAAWVKPSTLNGQPIISTEDVDNDVRTKGYKLGLNQTAANGVNANSVFVQFGKNAWGWNVYSSPTSSITTSSWQHVAVTLSGVDTASPTVKFYINGIERTATFWTGSTKGAIYWGDDANSNRIGSIYTATFPSYESGYFTGQIDEPRIFNYALTATQIKSLYNGGGAVRFGPVTGSP